MAGRCRRATCGGPQLPLSTAACGQSSHETAPHHYTRTGPHRGEHLLVEILREQVHLVRLVLASVALLPELELRERLVREGAGPHQPIVLQLLYIQVSSNRIAPLLVEAQKASVFAFSSLLSLFVGCDFSPPPSRTFPGGHHERRVARGAAQVQQAARRQHDHAVAVREDEAVHLLLR